VKFDPGVLKRGGLRSEGDRRTNRTLRVSPRQQEILKLAASGLTTKQIALQLKLAPRTVGTHFEKLFERNGVHSRTEAVALWLRRATETAAP